MTLFHTVAEFLTGINLTHLRDMEAHSSLENEEQKGEGWEQLTQGSHWQGRNLDVDHPSSKLASEFPDTPSSPSKCEKRRNKTQTIPQWFESFESPGCNLPHSNHRTILAAFTIAVLPFPLSFLLCSDINWELPEAEAV